MVHSYIQLDVTIIVGMLIQLKIVKRQPYAVAIEDIYHVYCAIWCVVVGEIFQCERKLNNVKDGYAVSTG